MTQKTVKSHWNERWRGIITKQPTNRNYYYISDYGRIKSVTKATREEHLVNGSKKKYGFKGLSVKLKGGRYYSTYIHKFVAEHFVEKEREDQVFVVHIDGDKTNNHYKNLKWLSRDELTAWHDKIGVFESTRQRNRKNVKMTEEKVRLLKKRIKEGKTKKKILAKSFGISTMQLNRIERGENWGHIA